MDNIWLTGFMGSGKSTVGRLLAKRLNREFVDMDEILEQESGRPIREIFALDGESFFRSRERDLLTRLAHRDRLVVATGGGAPADMANREAMRASGRIVFLACGFDLCGQRLSSGDMDLRPLWKNPDEAKRLFERREPVYRDADLKIEADDASPDETAGRIVTTLFPDRRLSLKTEIGVSEIAATWDAPSALSAMLGTGRAVILTDRNVARLHLDRFRARLNDPVVITLSGGERIKSLNQARRIYEGLLAHHINRDDVLVALGGGTVTDLGAFVAATYKRGMRNILIATTVLACVDAAVGGKAAVNLGPAKNIVGCFTSPEGVILDAAALLTLERREICEGLIEAFKTGLVAAPDLAEFIENHVAALLDKDGPLLAEAAWRSARTKADVVGEDFRETGRRAILNFGHTYGHAIETFQNYRIGHGRAVAAGMIASVALSERRGLLPGQIAKRIESVIRAIWPGTVPLPSAQEAWPILMHDKKIKQGRIRFVLLEDIGRPVVVNDVTEKELAAALKSLAADRG